MMMVSKCTLVSVNYTLACCKGTTGFQLRVFQTGYADDDIGCACQFTCQEGSSLLLCPPAVCHSAHFVP